jgi:hypothetical protein
VFVEVARISSAVFVRERPWVGVPGGDPFADVVLQRDNAFVDAAFGREVD